MVRGSEMITAAQVYRDTVRALPPAERLRLAALILDEMAARNEMVGLDGNWDADDMHDMVAHAFACADARYGCNDDAA
jgi:hypothetical protein